MPWLSAQGPWLPSGFFVKKSMPVTCGKDAAGDKRSVGDGYSLRLVTLDNLVTNIRLTQEVAQAFIASDDVATGGGVTGARHDPGRKQQTTTKTTWR